MKFSWWLLVFTIACGSPPAALPPGPAPAVATAVPAPRPPGPPPARVDPVVDTLHGAPVRDPYRWMESGGAELDSFLAAQAEHAKTTFAAIRGRDQLRAAIHAANQGVTRIAVVGVTGPIAAPRVFLTRRAPGEDSAQLFVRDGWTGKDRLLVDPRRRDRQGVHHSIDYAVAAPDGKHVAYGISASGSEDSVIEILEVATGKPLRERIDRAQYADIRWRDNRSLFYWRRRAPGPGDTRADWFKHSATYLHVLGDDPERAQPVASPAILDVPADRFTSIDSSPREPWALAVASPGTSADKEYFVAPRARVSPGKTPWRRLSGPRDQVVSMTAHGETIYALSYAGAPRYRVLAIDAAAGTLANAKVFVAEGAAVIEGMVAAQDALYLQLFDGGQNRIERVSYDGKQRRDLALPRGVTAAIQGDADRPGIVFSLEGWSRPLAYYRFDPATGMAALELHEPWPIDYAHVRSMLVEATSADGTKVPMSIIVRDDVPLTGIAPALLGGYQAYGNVEGPYFSPLVLAWVERGGVRAVCHGRGSGNLGKQWHVDGSKHHKERGVEDFIACAEYLVNNEYTSASRLTALGTSAGGLLVGGAITRRPELFAAALLRVPLANLMRFEVTEGGPANVPEFGTIADPADARAMRASDPYHRLVDGTRYPAMVVTGGKHDVRVPVWQPAKFAARAQAATGGDRPIVLRVEFAGGHGRGSTQTQVEDEWADLYAFALWQSGVPIDP